jgi:hypothetical protein
MTRVEQAVTVGVAALVMMMEGGAIAGEPGGQAKPRKATVRMVKPVTVTMSGKACGHHVTPRSERLNKTNGDALGWRIRNNCGSEQKVLICAYRGDELFNPFATCVSTPTAGLDIGTTFTVQGGKRENLDCVANVLGHYTKVVLVGDEVPSAGCPSGPHRKVGPRTHRLDVEIVR